MKTKSPNYLELILVGGGHAQIQVLKSFAMRPVAGVRLTLVTDVLYAPYSGMLPGFVEGHYSFEDMHIDLLALSRFAGARLIKKSVKDIDLSNNIIILEDDIKLYYDVLSLNCGAVPDQEGIKGGPEHGIFVKPISHFLAQLPEQDKIHGPVAVIGAGAAGCELALALENRYQLKARNIDLHLFGSQDSVLGRAPEKARRIMEKTLLDAGVKLYLGTPVREITDQHLFLSEHQPIAARHKFIVTPAQPASWIKALALTHDEQGFIAVRPTLQTIEYAHVFAAGDVASITHARRDKAGVFAVRSGPILAENLRAFIEKRNLRAHRPQKTYLAIIGLGQSQALAMRADFVMQGHLWWQIKQWIDRRFIRKFTELPGMRVESPKQPPLAKERITPEDSALSDGMFCAACGAKSAPDILEQALKDAIETAMRQGADKAYLPTSEIHHDHGTLILDQEDCTHDPVRLGQSVDFISQHVSDPFVFGRIAALHALSDIFVSAHKPVAALAIVSLSRVAHAMQLSDLTQMLSGALIELARHKTRLIGGHTTLSDEAMMGFAVTGCPSKGHIVNELSKQQQTAQQQICLILTKPLGIGLVLAAEMRANCPALTYQRAIEVMLQSNASAAQIAHADDEGVLMTDVTGFGLARHALNLAERFRHTGIKLYLDQIPVLDGTKELVEKGIRSSLFQANRITLDYDVSNRPSCVHGWKEELLFDPQTSGGILIAVKADRARELQSKLYQAGYRHSAIIGYLDAQAKGIILAQKDEG